jgi:hypothetical protein
MKTKSHFQNQRLFSTFEAHPAFYPEGTGGFYPKVKAADA